jgi:hypothetical protein
VATLDRNGWPLCSEIRNFDEEAYQFEKAQMDRRRELEELRMHIQEEMHEAFRALDEKGSASGPASDTERRSIERRFEAQLEKLENEIRAMEERMQQYWADRQHEEGANGEGGGEHQNE